MDNPTALEPLFSSGNHPADIMIRVSHVAAFLTTTLDGEHVKPDGIMTLHPEAISGLAHIMGFIQAAADHASTISGE